MTKTHAELLPCPFCGERPEIIEGTDDCEQKESVINTFEICCHKCEVITFPCEEFNEISKRWNNRTNKHAEFLEELKQELIAKKKLLWAENSYDDMYTGGREWEIGEMIDKIKQFQAEQRVAENDKQ